ncbi:MAG: hypothetical protein K6G42_09010 [Lachnospiraceae bacterium]|nr:hypothetical protein [Lachnospiraceae bacterium]
MKKVIITLAVALLITASAVAFKNVYSCEMPIQNRGIRDAVNTGDLDVLFIGSSTFRANVDMPMMDEAYDGRVYDISYGGNQLVATAIQYEEIKKRSDNEYGLMVFELGPMMITQEVALSDSRVIWDLSFPGKTALWQSMYEAGNTDFSMFYEYFVTSGMDDLITFPITERFYSTRYYKGAKTDESVSPGAEWLENEEFDISGKELVPAQADAVIDIIEECKRDGQPFVFLESPCYYRLQEDPAFERFRGQFIKLLDENEAPYILASDVDFDSHEADYFEDMNHMSAAGRREYTKELIRVLKENGEKLSQAAEPK